MEKLKISDINWQELKELPHQGSTSIIYKDPATSSIYKFLTEFSKSEKDALYHKFMDMDGIQIDRAILPEALIMDNDTLEVYRMKELPNSIPLSTQFEGRFVDSSKLLPTLVEASKILRTFHQAGIIYTDLSFENILVNEMGPFFCDFDSCSYQNHRGTYISLLLKRFMVDYRQEQFEVSDNLDRISMLLSFFYLLYGKEIQTISTSSYYRLAKNSATLKNAQPYVKSFLNTRRAFSATVPYLDELIDLKDAFIVDKEKEKVYSK